MKKRKILIDTVSEFQYTYICSLKNTAYGPVAQLVRALACHARGRGFEPHPGRQYASVAQSVEQGTENPRVGGSIPL